MRNNPEAGESCDFVSVYYSGFQPVKYFATSLVSSKAHLFSLNFQRLQLLTYFIFLSGYTTIRKLKASFLFSQGCISSINLKPDGNLCRLNISANIIGLSRRIFTRICPVKKQLNREKAKEEEKNLGFIDNYCGNVKSRVGRNLFG